MSRFLKNLAKTAQNLYYGNTRAPFLADKVTNFADYLGDKKLRSAEEFRNATLNSQQAGDSKIDPDARNSNKRSEEESEVEEAEIVHEEPQPKVQKKASVAFMMKLDLIELGYDLNDIKKMTPAEAQELLAEGIKKN